MNKIIKEKISQLKPSATLAINEETNKLKKEGFVFIYEKPKVGAHNCLINFIHPKSTGGILIEVSQKQE